VSGYYIHTSGGAGSYINCGSNASIDNIWAGAGATVDFWIQAEETGYLLGKGLKWYTILSSSDMQFLIAYGLGSYAGATIDVAGFLNKWHHVVMTYNNTGDRKIYVAIDGVWQTYKIERAHV
jgi:hypothetical protein